MIPYNVPRLLTFYSAPKIQSNPTVSMISL
jgi:hypothetical protein